METLRVTPADPIYQQRATKEREWEEEWGLAPFLTARMQAAVPLENRALTGDPQRGAIEELAARGPFARALLLGGDCENEAEAWMRAGGSQALDVVEANPRRLERLRPRLAAYGDRVRLQRQDLNFLALPREHYDVVIAASGTFRVANLEFFFDEIAQALQPGGLLGIISYVGERRQLYTPARLALVNAVLNEMPARFRLDDGNGIGPANQNTIAPFGAVRSDEILPVARARFDVVEERLSGHLFPLHLYLDLATMAREAPELIEQLITREREIASDPAATACTAYVVLAEAVRQGFVAAALVAAWRCGAPPGGVGRGIATPPLHPARRLLPDRRLWQAIPIGAFCLLSLVSLSSPSAASNSSAQPFPDLSRDPRRAGRTACSARTSRRRSTRGRGGSRPSDARCAHRRRPPCRPSPG